MIQVGSEAPDFELPSSELTPEGKAGRKIALGDYRGKKNVVLVFYPLDWSPVCTREHGCLREDIAMFDAKDAQVLGISVDSAWTHLAFVRHAKIPYPLLADFHPKGAIARAYGLFEDERGYASRATVIVDKGGKVAWVENHGLGNARDDAKIVAVLEKLS